MNEIEKIPIFPLNILPLPEEYIPLHIFEPRYRQLQLEIEKYDKGFGILYAGRDNEHHMGGYMKMESILKNYDTGESDVLYKCTGVFIMTRFYKTMPGKLYPGGEVYMLPHGNSKPSPNFEKEFLEYMHRKKINQVDEPIYLQDIANELNLETPDRLKYLRILDIDKREKFLSQRLRYNLHILNQETSARNKFNLN
jgi:uncharacterized protein